MAHKRILVMQMTRMGDVLQTSPLVRALKQQNPHAHVTVMIRRMGVAIAENNPDIDEIIVYEEDETYLDLRSEDADRLLKAYETTSTYVDRLRNGNFDIAYNCTHSLCSAMLLKLARIPKVVGAHLSEDWRYIWRGRGPNYFITSVLHRDANDLNLCDSFRYFLEDPPVSQGLVFAVPKASALKAQAVLTEHGIAPNDSYICFQLGASDKDKRWPESRFAALALQLSKSLGVKILLVGVKEEAVLGTEFERHAPGLAVHLFGKTSIPELAEILRSARVLVTNDTGTMHIAAAVNCPIVLVSVGYVHFRETGPYGAGHVAIESCRESAGRSDMRGRDTYGSGVTPEHVTALVRLITHGVSEVALDIADFDGVDVFQSSFARDGCLQWYPMFRRAASEADIVRMAYRPMWLEDFSRRTDESKLRESIAALAVHFAPPADLTCWERLSAAIGGLVEMANRGSSKTKELITHLGEQGQMRLAKQLVTELMALDDEIRIYAELHSVCKPLVAIARFERDNLEGADPAELARRTLEIYDDLGRRARTLNLKLTLVRSALDNA